MIEAWRVLMLQTVRRLILLQEKPFEIAPVPNVTGTISTIPQWTRRGEWLLLALLVAYLCGHTLPHAWKTLNTDFPNYYLTAHLARNGMDTSRAYEWVWLQRQKDHLEIDQRIVGLVPITPFSTLFVWPLTQLAPLAAKHCWLILNSGMLFAIGLLLRSLSRLAWRRIALVIALSFPLHKNFLYGQYYVLLLLILTLACWCYVRQRRFISGLLIGLGFGLKLFPLLYLFYFLRKKDWKAVAGGIVGSTSAAVVSIAVFGLQLNRVLIVQVLPWTLRGEGMDPYNLSSASIATLLHRLFIYEPQWNPHPFTHSPWALALLLPLAQTLLFAPALLMADPENNTPGRLQMEWSAVLIGSLAISTLPASYHFTLLILPVCVMWSVLQARATSVLTGSMLLLYVVIGYPGWLTIGAASGVRLLSVPRLYLLILLCLFNYSLLWTSRQRSSAQIRVTRIWAGAFALMTVFSIASSLRHQQGLYSDYQYRLPAADGMLQAIAPVTQNNSVLFTEMVPAGYRAASLSDGSLHIDNGSMDQLSLAATTTERWTEEVSSESTIVSDRPGREEIHQAQSPLVAPNGRWLAFLREERGQARIWVRMLDQSTDADKVLTPSELNVLEMTFLPNGSLVFAAMQSGSGPGLFAVDRSGALRPFGPEEARYPSVSPNGHWLVYSKLQGGNWNIWLRDLQNGETSRLTHAECNDIQSTWTADSQSLIYGSDCGRALWFTALCRRRILSQ